MNRNLNSVDDDLSWREQFKWETFLKPLRDKESIRLYDAGFTIKPPEPEIDLAKLSRQIPGKGNECLSRIIVQSLTVQHRQVQRSKKQGQRIVNSQIEEIITPGRNRRSDEQSNNSSQTPSWVRNLTSAFSGHPSPSANQMFEGVVKTSQEQFFRGSRTCEALTLPASDACYELTDSGSSGEDCAFKGTKRTFHDAVHDVVKKFKSDISDIKKDTIVLDDSEDDDEIEWSQSELLSTTVKDEVGKEAFTMVKVEDKKEATLTTHHLQTPQRVNSGVNLENRFKNEIEEDDLEEYEDDDDLQGNEEVQLAQSLIQRKELIRNFKSDIQKPASKWNDQYLNNYLKPDRIILEKLMTNEDPGKNVQFSEVNRLEMKKSFVSLSKQCLHDDQQFTENEKSGLRLWSFQFRRVTNEDMISCFVQRLLGTICELNGAKLKPELSLQDPKSTPRSTDFANARPDFVLEYKGVLFGMVEVKRPEKLNSSAVAQLLLPMFKTQHKYLLDKMRFIGILTDGFRFVLMKLERNAFTFEPKELLPSPRLMVHYARCWEDLFQICSGLNGLMKSAIANINTIANA